MFAFESQSPNQLVAQLQTLGKELQSTAGMRASLKYPSNQLSFTGKNPHTDARFQGSSELEIPSPSNTFNTSAISQNSLNVARLRILLLLTAYNNNERQFKQLQNTPAFLSQVGHSSSSQLNTRDGICGHLKNDFQIGSRVSGFNGTGAVSPEQIKSVINLRKTLIQLRLSQELIIQLNKLQILQGSLQNRQLSLRLQMSKVNPAQKLANQNSSCLKTQRVEEEKKIEPRVQSPTQQDKPSSVEFDQQLQEVLIEKEQEQSTLQRQICNSQSEFIKILAEVGNPDQEIFHGQPRGQFRKNGQPFTSSQYRGVSKNGRKYQMFIMVNGKKKMYIGGYESSAIAARAYDRAAIQMRGIKARTNFSYSKTEVLEILSSPPVFPMQDENLKQTFSIWRSYQIKQGHL